MNQDMNKLMLMNEIDRRWDEVRSRVGNVGAMEDISKEWNDLLKSVNEMFQYTRSQWVVERLYKEQVSERTK